MCWKHPDFPKIMDCIRCKEEYEQVIFRWQGQEGVDKFRKWYESEKLLEAIRNL